MLILLILLIIWYTAFQEIATPDIYISTKRTKSDHTYIFIKYLNRSHLANVGHFICHNEEREKLACRNWPAIRVLRVNIKNVTEHQHQTGPRDHEMRTKPGLLHNHI